MCFAMFTTECRRDVCNKDLKTLRLHLTTCIKGSHSSEQWTLHYLGGSKYTIQTAGLSKRCLHSTPKTSLTLSADCSTADLHHSSVWEIYNLAAEIPQAELTWIDHKVRPDVDFSRLTWQKAAELCQGFGADLCFRGDDVCPNGADHPPAVGKWDFLQETVPSTSDLWAAYRVCQGPRPVGGACHPAPASRTRRRTSLIRDLGPQRLTADLPQSRGLLRKPQGHLRAAAASGRVAP
ncbi:unnamed protein product [Effrenium voratum]|nr:unnamed protein product [Effrenium voratum]